MPLEQQLLPDPTLKPWYDRVVWLFVTRNFKGDGGDLEALRTHDRFGVSSWPQMLVFDPSDDRVLVEPPRDRKGFERAFEQAVAAHRGKPDAGAERAAAVVAEAKALLGRQKLAAARDLLEPVAREEDRAGVWLEARALMNSWAGAPEPSLPALLEDPDPRVVAIALERAAAQPQLEAKLLARAGALLGDPAADLVVRIRALRLVAKATPEAVVDRAAELLKVANDPFRYEVLDLLARHPRPALGPALAVLFRDAGEAVPSRNPNVLRMRTAACLAESGGTEAIDALAPLVRTADWRNGTTKVSLQALAGIARRLPAERDRIAALLLDAFPRPVPAEPANQARASLALAASVREALAAARPQAPLPALPKAWDEAARTQWLAEVRAAAR
ncbi:MAG: hypothetical protein IT458_06010 [Planctomycetes bacterium]|nr:hypothetical protein [Planctomycetota bacterium]